MDLSWTGFSIPLKVPFRGVTHRRGALVRGPQGWGEFSPFPGYPAARWRRCIASALCCAFEPWPAPVRDAVAVHATVPAVGAQEAAALVASSGCLAAKVKVAEGDDEARVEAVRHALGPAGRLVIDANGAWTVQQAASAIRRLSRYGLDLVEQPVREIADLARLRRKVNVALAADESASSPGALRSISKLEAADVVVIKVQSFGGVPQALRAIQAGALPAVVSSLVETSVGVSAGLALAAALPELPYPCGLGTVPLLAGDLTARSLIPVRGMLAVSRPDVHPGLLARFQDRCPLIPPADDVIAVFRALR